MFTAGKDLIAKIRRSALLTFALILTLAGAGLFSVPDLVRAGVNTTGSIGVYVDGAASPVGVITSAAINSAASYANRQYSGRKNNGAAGYYTTYGSSLTSLLNDVLAGTSYDTGDVARVDFYSPVGPNNTRIFCQPQQQLFTDRKAYSNVDSGSPLITAVPAILATTSALPGSPLNDDDAIRLFFGTTSASEKNIPYFTTNITRIDLYTSASCPADHYGY